MLINWRHRSFRKKIGKRTESQNFGQRTAPADQLCAVPTEADELIEQQSDEFSLVAHHAANRSVAS